MATDSIAKGDEFFDKAQKKLKSFSFFGEAQGIPAVPPQQQHGASTVHVCIHAGWLSAAFLQQHAVFEDHYHTYAEPDSCATTRPH
jgi:hypothetical protein